MTNKISMLFIFVLIIMLRLTNRPIALFATLVKGQPAPIIKEESFTIVDPNQFEDSSLISRIQNWMRNREHLTDIKRSFKEFNIKTINSHYINRYNQVVKAV